MKTDSSGFAPTIRVSTLAAAWEKGMRDARDLVHEILKGECAFHEELGWSHGWRCDSIRDVILGSIIAHKFPAESPPDRCTSPGCRQPWDHFGPHG